MKKLIMTVVLLMSIFMCSFVQAEDKAPSTLIQGSATWGDMNKSDSLPYFETGKNPTGGDLELVYRVNISKQAVLLGFHFDFGVNKEKLDVDDLKLKTNLGFSIGPTCRINYGVLHAEAGFSVGAQAYVFGYIPNEMDENANGYAMESWGMNGKTFLRLGVGSFFVGSLFGIENPLGGEPGKLKPAVAYILSDIDGNQYIDMKVDTSNVGKVSRESGRTRMNGSLLMGFWF